MKFKLGLKPARHDERTLKFAKYADVAALPYPANPAVDWFAARLKLAPMPVWGNDQYGDCFWAMMANLLQVDSANAGSMIQLAESDVLAAYSACTGFNPADPSTDQGTDMLNGLNFMRTTGIAGNKIGAFMSVDPTNQREIVSALWLFGHLMFGVTFYEDWENSDDWTLPDSSAIAGGHAILGGACVLPGAVSKKAVAARAAALREWLTRTAAERVRKEILRLRETFGGDFPEAIRERLKPVPSAGPTAIRIASWGSDEYQIPWAGFGAVDQLYICLTSAWLDANQTAPNGFNLAALQSDLALVTA